MKKALIVTHVSGFVPQFEMNNVQILKEMGFQIHVASNYEYPFYGSNERLNETGIIQHQIDFVRNPYDTKNIKAYRQLKKLMTEEKFDLVHCHNPISGVIARLAASRTQTKRVIYTAHGFHFYKGAPLINWLVYFTIEYLLAYLTDVMICINTEDYKRAKKYFHAKKILYIPGVGIDLTTIEQVEVDIAEKRKELNIPNNASIIVTSGELSRRKNQDTIIKALAALKDTSIYCLICGSGGKEEHLKKLVYKLRLSRQVVFMGYRDDIYEILKMSDIFVFSSRQEGLSRSLMEALACGLPIVCSNIRGNNELVDSKGGFLVDPMKPVEFQHAIEKLCSNQVLKKQMGSNNKKRAQQFSNEIITKQMEIIYRKIIYGYYEKER